MQKARLQSVAGAPGSTGAVTGHEGSVTISHIVSPEINGGGGSATTAPAPSAIASRALGAPCPLSGKPDIGADMAPRRLLTHLGHLTINFAVTHNSIFRVTCSNVRLRLGSEAHEAPRFHHCSRWGVRARRPF